MTQEKSTAHLTYDASAHCYFCEGHWSVTTVGQLISSLKDIHLPDNLPITISGEKLSYFDSASALALEKFALRLRKKNHEVKFTHFSKEQRSLFTLLENNKETLSYEAPPSTQKNILHRIGEEAIEKIDQADGIVILIGDLSVRVVNAFSHWRRFRFPSILSNLYSAGLQALPILALLSFLIGVVLAYQMGLQLQTYGAANFIAYLSGIAIFREFAPLITAIIVAGRTSSAFTAQIGSMKINEEIDALHTMGLSPTELLVMPKVFALLFIFPLLIFWSDFFSLLGSMYMSKWMLGVGYFDFLNRLKDSVGTKQLLVGLYKAPAFALIVSLVGCFQGFAVESNADSIGSQTTKSVVQALFLIIVADAIYSVVYRWLDL